MSAILTSPKRRAATKKRSAQLPSKSGFIINRFSVKDYHAMGAAGLIPERTELINGMVVLKMPKNRPHVITSEVMKAWLMTRLPRGFELQTQQPVRAVDSEPEPDLAVIRGTASDYRKQHPGSRHVPLVIEVSEATVRADRGVKMRMYARSGFETYWVVNLPAGRVEVYTEPSKTGYKSCRTYLAGDTIPLAIGGATLTVPVDEILPPTPAQ